ncbi:hydantoinase/oxoprolinase family protein [Streptomyces sp. NBC_00239]|uniref:hydantoinase/oxoprolinase family protein n=1 Tax=Streptomyces sp. NBC_00239 TaxID=2903640 RepID=UPI002E285C5D|nr:hydantoinase/oxoprolinase family protein [Streptomyces sp. NBC_00239]
MRLGVDVGRVTTVAVLVGPDGRTVARAVVDSVPGLGECLRSVLAALPGDRTGEVDAVGLTTDLERRPSRLRRVAALRIAPPSHPSLGPLAGWPAQAAREVGPLHAVVPGGSALTGRQLARLDRGAVAEFARRAAEDGVTAFSVAAAGALTRPDPEVAAAEVIAEAVPGAEITLSHELGRAGLRERENTAVINAALRPWAARVSHTAERALRAGGLRAPLFLARNTGGLVSTVYFRRYPVLAIASTTASAVRGAALAAGADRALVVDAGAAEFRCASVTDGEVERSDVGPGLGGVDLDLARIRTELLARVDLVRTGAEQVADLVARVRRRTPGGVLLAAGGDSGLVPVGAPDPAAAIAAAAYGAACSEIVAEVDQVAVAGGSGELERLLGLARDQALARVVAAGAAPDTARIAFAAHTPVSYLPEGVHRLRVRAAGSLGNPGMTRSRRT